MTQKIRSKTLNASLHGARGIAALMVVFSHIGAGGVTEVFFGELSLPLVLFKYVLLSGQYGVEIFFMISGYLITASVIRHKTVSSFLLDRCVRLYPVFVPALMLIFFVGPFIGYSYFDDMSWMEWVGYFVINLAFLPGVIPIQAALIVAWSLSYEAAFYLALAFIKYFNSKRVLIYLFLLFLALPLVLLLPRTLFFLVGVFIYYIPRGKVVFQFRLPSLFFINLLAFLGVLFTLQFRGEINLVVSDWSVLLLWASSLVIGYLIFIEIVMESPRAAALFRWRWVQFLGTISYSLYVWHTLIMFGTKRVSSVLVGVLGEIPAFAIFAVTSLALSVAMSYVSYVLFEKRLTQWLSSRREERSGPL